MRRDEVKRTVKLAVVAIAGRPIRCEVCGEVMVKAIPIIWKGDVKLIGAEAGLVAVDFASMNRLVFRHVEVGACAARRP
ncbi:MAG: hypothetical protein ACSLFR_08395 [Solirubrobacteraceae bacterium]